MSNAPWPVEVRVAVCLDIAQGLPVRAAAAKHGVPEGSAARWWANYRARGGERASKQPKPGKPASAAAGTFRLAELREADRKRILRFKDLALDELCRPESFGSAESVEKVGRVALALNRVARVFPDLLAMNEQLADDAGTGGRTLDQEAREVLSALELDDDADLFGAEE